MAAATAPAWVAAARARATCAPAAPRMALLLGGERVGSVDGRVFDEKIRAALFEADMREVVISAGGVSVRARLLDTPTAERIWQAYERRWSPSERQYERYRDRWEVACGKRNAEDDQ